MKLNIIASLRRIEIIVLWIVPDSIDWLDDKRHSITLRNSWLILPRSIAGLPAVVTTRLIYLSRENERRCKNQLWDSREAGVQLGAQFLDREDRVLVLGMRALQAVIYAAAQAMTG